MAAFRKGLSEAGYVEGRNVAIEYRWAHNELDRLPELAADLVRRQVAVIAAPGSAAAALAAKAATTTIPIVFGDRRRPGPSRSRRQPQPAGRQRHRRHLHERGAWGQAARAPARAAAASRALCRARQSEQSACRVARSKDAQAAAAAIGRQIEVLTASTNREIDAAFASLAQKRADALLVGPDPFFNNRRVQLATLAARHAVPAIYAVARVCRSRRADELRSEPRRTQYRQAGIYTGRILKGEKPADLPVLQPTKFEFVINLQTARTLGLDVPPTLLAQRRRGDRMKRRESSFSAG